MSTIKKLLVIIGATLAAAVAAESASLERAYFGISSASAEPSAFASQPEETEQPPDDEETIVADDEGTVVSDDEETIVSDDEETIVPDDSKTMVKPEAEEEPASSAPSGITEAETTPIVEPAREDVSSDVNGATEPDARVTLAQLIGDAASTLLVSGYIQADYARHDISLDELSDGTREPLNEDRFLIRRARLRLDKEWQYVGLAGETEFFAGGSTARPVAFDLHAQLPADDGGPPLARFIVGLFPIPFTYQNQEQRAFQNFFAERALMTDAFLPGRFDLGVAIGGQIWAVDWTLAAQNGQPLGTDKFSYEDPNSAKDYAGRVQVSGKMLGGVHASTGVSFLSGTGFSPGTAPTKDSFEWRDLNEDGRVIQSELIPITGSAGRASENFERWGLGGDLRVWTDIPSLGELRVDAEIALGNNLDRGVAPADPILLGRDQRSLGYYASMTQMVRQHWQVGIRYDQYEPNIDELELLEGRTLVTRRKFRTFTGGVSARLRLSEYARARVHLEYAHQRNSLGRNEQGKPDNLDNDALRVRWEMVF